MKTMKEAGISRTLIINYTVDRLKDRFDLTKAQATEYFNESLAYNTVQEAIFERIEWMLESGHRLDWTSDEGV